MKQISNINEALALYEQKAIKRGEALEEGRSKIANRCYDSICDIVSFLRAQKELKRLAIFYNHPNPYVRLNAAAYLLPLFEEKSLQVMEEIAQGIGPAAWNAKMTIQEWKSGNLKNYYTL